MVIQRWRQRREDKWWEQWQAENRWSALGSYNAEVARGIVHTREYDAAMAAEQALFNEEMGLLPLRQPVGCQCDYCVGHDY